MYLCMYVCMYIIYVYKHTLVDLKYCKVNGVIPILYVDQDYMAYE